MGQRRSHLAAPLLRASRAAALPGARRLPAGLPGDLRTGRRRPPDADGTLPSRDDLLRREHRPGGRNPAVLGAHVVALGRGAVLRRLARAAHPPAPLARAARARRGRDRRTLRVRERAAGRPLARPVRRRRRRRPLQPVHARRRAPARLPARPALRLGSVPAGRAVAAGRRGRGGRVGRGPGGSARDRPSCCWLALRRRLHADRARRRCDPARRARRAGATAGRGAWLAPAHVHRSDLVRALPLEPALPFQLPGLGVQPGRRRRARLRRVGRLLPVRRNAGAQAQVALRRGTPPGCGRGRARVPPGPGEHAEKSHEHEVAHEHQPG